MLPRYKPASAVQKPKRLTLKLHLALINFIKTKRLAQRLTSPQYFGSPILFYDDGISAPQRVKRLTIFRPSAFFKKIIIYDDDL